MKTRFMSFFLFPVLFLVMSICIVYLAYAGSTVVTNEGVKFPDGTTQTTAASGGTGQWSTSGAGIYYNSGNVGIGTSIPQKPFHLFASSDAIMLIQPENPVCGGSKARIEFWNGSIGHDTEWRPGFIEATDQECGTFEGGMRFVVNGSGYENKTGEVEVVRLTKGNVGIGTTTPSYKLHVNGDAAGTSWTNLSSVNFKEDIHKLDETDYPMMLAKVMAMKPTTYKYKKEYGGDGTTKLGFIAEDMPEEVLSKDGKGVDLYELLTLAIGAMKAQQQKIADLEARINEIQQAQSK